MTTAKAERAAQLLQKIKVAKIQKDNFERLNQNQMVSFEKAGEAQTDTCVFCIGENIEGGNWILVQAIKVEAVKYLEGYIGRLNDELDEL